MMKDRVTLTIDQSLLRQIDARIDGTAVKNRSHAVEVLLKQAIKGHVPECALILAGGKTGTKSLSLVEGKSALQHNLDLLTKYGVTNIVIAAGNNKKEIEAALQLPENIQVTYLEEGEQLGTAGPIKSAAALLGQKPFVVMNADELKDINLEQLYEQHVKNECLATIALTTAKDARSYGTAMLDGNRILRFIEKPEDEHTHLINAGCYVFEPKVIEHIPEGFAMLEIDLFPKLARQGELYGYPFAGQWIAPR